MTKNYVEWKNTYPKVGMKKLNQFNVDTRAIQQVIKKYPIKVNPYYLSLIEKKNDPIWKQCIPDLKELTDIRGETDPLREDQYSPCLLYTSPSPRDRS